MLRSLLLLTTGMIFCWLTALPVYADSDTQSFQIEGRDSARGDYTGQLTLDPREDGSGNVDAVQTVEFEDGITQEQHGVLAPRGDRLRGTLSQDAGLVNGLEGSAPASSLLSVTVDDDGDFCVGTSISPSGISSFSGELEVLAEIPLEDPDADPGVTAADPSPDPDPVNPPRTQRSSGEQFAKRMIYDFDPAIGITTTEGAYRVAVNWDNEDKFVELLEGLIDDPKFGEIDTLVIGYWGDDRNSQKAAETLVANAPKLTGIKALFVGDIDQEEAEISWINQSDLGPLVQAIPSLETLKVRGGMDLAFSGAFRHENLKRIFIESGGTDRAAAIDLGKLDLPALEELELWLGSDEYGADTTVADLEGILDGSGLPALKTLGLMNSSITSDIAKVIGNSAVLPQLKALNLSMGTLDDQGAEAILAQPDKFDHLDRLSLHFHYMTDAVMDRFETFSVDTGTGDQQEIDPQDPDWRYTEVGE
jgi:hypothetical protein